MATDLKQPPSVPRRAEGWERSRKSSRGVDSERLDEDDATRILREVEKKQEAWERDRGDS
jgi:hypothetical protein